MFSNAYFYSRNHMPAMQAENKTILTYTVKNIKNQDTASSISLFIASNARLLAQLVCFSRPLQHGTLWLVTLYSPSKHETHFGQRGPSGTVVWFGATVI